jgi:hypothetical protein
MLRRLALATAVRGGDLPGDQGLSLSLSVLVRTRPSATRRSHSKKIPKP